MGDVLDDFFGEGTSGFSITTITDLYKDINQQRIDAGLAKQRNTIEELNASTEMLRTQNENLLAQAKLAAENKGVFDFSGFDFKKYAPYALLAGGAYLAYRFLK